MTLRLLISLSLWLAAPLAWAQTAEEIFNGGAQLYISNNIPTALEKVTEGRKLYPEDEKLKKLEELLKQQQQSRQNQKQDQQQKQDQKQDQQKQDSQSGQKPDEPQQPQPSKPQDRKNGQKDEQKQEAQEKPGQMTPQEAKRLLDSEKNDEQFLVPKPEGKPEHENKPVKDW